MANPLKENFIDSPEMVELIGAMLRAKDMEILPSILKKRGRLKKRPKKNKPKWMNDYHSSLLTMSRPSSKNIPMITTLEEYLEIALVNWRKFDRRRRSVALHKSKWNDLKKFINVKYPDISVWADDSTNDQLGKVLLYLSAAFSPWLFFHTEGVELYSEERMRLTACSDMLEKLEAFGMFGDTKNPWYELWNRVQIELEIKIAGLPTSSDFTSLEPLLSWIVDYCDECGIDQSTNIIVKLIRLFKQPRAIFPSSGIRLSLERYLSIRRSFLGKTRLVESEYGLMFKEDVQVLKELEEYKEGLRSGSHPLFKYTKEEPDSKRS